MTNVNWVTTNELQDAGLLERYAISLYWATVTCTTVGYGDVLPTNEYELLWAMMVIVFGVAIFSYILSNLASQFSEISRNRAHNQDRLNQIEQLDTKFKIGQVLVDQLRDHFENYNAEQDLETNQEMSYLLKILPSTLKTRLAKFLFQQAIYVNRFLQDRGDNFYSKYLEELKAERFQKDDIIAKPGQDPENVYFIMAGIVLNNSTKRYFESGQMINHDVIYKKEVIRDEYIAVTDVAVVKFEKSIFV